MVPNSFSIWIALQLDQGEMPCGLGPMNGWLDEQRKRLCIRTARLYSLKLIKYNTILRYGRADRRGAGRQNKSPFIKIYYYRATRGAPFSTCQRYHVHVIPIRARSLCHRRYHRIQISQKEKQRHSSTRSTRREDKIE